MNSPPLTPVRAARFAVLVDTVARTESHPDRVRHLAGYLTDRHSSGAPTLKVSRPTWSAPGLTPAYGSNGATVVPRCTLCDVPAAWIANTFLKFAPVPRLIKAGLFVRYAPGDALDKLAGRSDPLVPPRRKVGGGSRNPAAPGPFRESGDQAFAELREYGQIAPHHAILDMGCGMGRLARPLTKFLDPAKGRYEGFDINASELRWCSEHYASHPNFHFQRANIYNKMYNPKGTVQAEEFVFPYPDESFDFAFASSLFTHMPLPAVAQYLKETARVLAAGARALLTVYLWNPEAQALVAQGKSALAFRPHGDLIVMNPIVPEAAIALPQEGWDLAVRDAGLEQVGDVLWGSWCGRTNFARYQDAVVLRKPV
ncbi:class I SAM-dependent methyltransferase [Mycobacterium simiae]|uniref:Class I SAM-dependent methyltransferase n=1 Tax=Mycobacterium simiae TaxID=1784 RepID=A0A5B1BTR6_MYCSI|nr:class I SAM-dependent methyltransferase [Mycobacterium simiae]